VFLQYFDTVGWVFGPVKTVSQITYTVLVETLNHAQSNNQKYVICLDLLRFWYPLLFIINIVLPARRYASAGNSDRNVSVSLSVCHARVLCQNEES